MITEVKITTGKHMGRCGVIDFVTVDNEYPHYYIRLDGDNKDTVFFNDEFEVITPRQD